ncbi:MAG: hypothetical protein ACLFUB_04165 [Cyclobacteriaceae bacterium]
MNYQKRTIILHRYHKVFALLGLFILCLAAYPEELRAQGKPPSVKVTPNLKVKKKKEAPAPPRPSKGNKVKADYKRPPSRANSGEVKDRYTRPQTYSKRQKKYKDTYERPASQRVNFNVGPDDTGAMPSPEKEEGGELRRPGLLMRLLHRNSPTLYGGRMRYRKIQQPEGTEVQGNLRRLKPAIAEKRERRQQQKMAEKVSGSRVPTPKRQERIESRQSNDLQTAGMYKIKKGKDQAEAYTTYKGSIRVPTPKARTRHFKKLSAKVHQYDGDLRYRKPGKDMHPSVFYLKGKRKDFDDKEQYRKKRLFILNIFKGKDVPKHLKEKERKPRYDKDESEIWYY